MANSIRPPEWLDDDAKKEFKRVVGVLNGEDSYTTLKKADVAILSTYSHAVSHYRKCVEEINKFGDTIHREDRYGHEVIYANPAVKIADTYYAQILKCCAKLGLSPIDRLKLGDDGDLKDNKFIEMLKGG